MFHEFNLSIDQLMVFANISNVAPFNNLDICIYKCIRYILDLKIDV